MSILAESVQVVVGVDTHKATHTAAVVSVVSGSVLGHLTVPADREGFGRLVAWADGFCSRRVWAVEGTGSYGAGLLRFLAGEMVVEVDRPRRGGRRNRAKSDLLDAVAAAREAMSRPVPARPRSRGLRAGLAALLAVYESATAAAALAQRQLGDLAVTAPEALRSRLGDRSGPAAMRTVSRWRPQQHWDPETLGYATAMVELARRWAQLQQQANRQRQAISRIVASWRPDLLRLNGVGPIVAAMVLCAWSHPGRIRSEAAFAALAGVAPIPASSGRIQRHRLNRNGDRRLNRAIHIITLSRLRYHPETRQYVQRRQAEGKTSTEIRRCLKRYVARQLYHQLEHPH